MALSRWAALGSRIAACSLLAFAAAASQAQGRYAISSDGQEVTDSTSHLTWRRCAEGMRWDGKTCAGKQAKYTYAGAKKAAEAAKGAGKAWRIPTRDELVALFDQSAKKKPKIDAQAFPKASNGPFWASRPGSDDDLNAWLVHMGSGKVRANLGQSKFPLLLVRASS